MSWVRIDDGAPDHPKLLKAGAEACWLWVCGLAYCNRQAKKRDGFIPTEKVPALYPIRGAMRLADKLVEVGLWERVDGGFLVHDYLEFQPTSDLRAARAEAGRRGGQRSGEVRRSNGEAKPKQVASTKEPIGSNPDPDPDPDPEKNPPVVPRDTAEPYPREAASGSRRIPDPFGDGTVATAWAEGVRQGAGTRPTVPRGKELLKLLDVEETQGNEGPLQARCDRVTALAAEFGREERGKALNVWRFADWVTKRVPPVVEADASFADDDPDYPDPKTISAERLAERIRDAAELERAIGVTH